MGKLTEMGEEAAQTFLDYSIRSYVKDSVDVGRQSADGAIERRSKLSRGYAIETCPSRLQWTRCECQRIYLSCNVVVKDSRQSSS